MARQTVGRTIKRLREAKGWTQQALAERVDLTDAYVNQLERGVRRNPSLAVLQRLARVLEVPLVDLLVNREGWLSEDSLDAPVLRTREEAEAVARVHGAHTVWQLFEAGVVPRIRGPYPVRSR
jgi:transcriptional regulator with XRE-family HTH domain